MSREQYTEFAGPWREAGARVGITSFRKLAERAGLGHQTVLNNISGRAKPRPETVRAMAQALHVDEGVVWSWLGAVKPADTGEFVPHPFASRLTPKQRAAVNQIIVAMVDPGGVPDMRPPREDVPVERWEEYGLAARRVDKHP